jgi:hypothetical protein
MKNSKYSANLTGQRFGKLVVVAFLWKRNGYYVWSCLCDCGKKIRTKANRLIRGETRSCRCISSQSGKTHGLRKHPLYTVWVGMRVRCNDAKSSAYENYGGRGVKVCQEWNDDFYMFYQWAINNGWQRGLDLDKDIKGDGMMYSPETCCFVTRKENANARRNCKSFEYRGKSMKVSELAETYNMPIKILSNRLSAGWEVERALTQSIRLTTGRKKYLS